MFFNRNIKKILGELIKKKDLIKKGSKELTIEQKLGLFATGFSIFGTLAGFYYGAADIEGIRVSQEELLEINRQVLEVVQQKNQAQETLIEKMYAERKEVFDRLDVLEAEKKEGSAREEVLEINRQVLEVVQQKNQAQETLIEKMYAERKEVFDRLDVLEAEKKEGSAREEVLEAEIRRLRKIKSPNSVWEYFASKHEFSKGLNPEELLKGDEEITLKKKEFARMIEVIPKNPVIQSMNEVSQGKDMGTQVEVPSVEGIPLNAKELNQLAENMIQSINEVSLGTQVESPSSEVKPLNENELTRMVENMPVVSPETPLKSMNEEIELLEKRLDNLNSNEKTKEG